jgi:hypothetical protein
MNFSFVSGKKANLNIFFGIFLHVLLNHAIFSGKGLSDLESIL